MKLKKLLIVSAMFLSMGLNNQVLAASSRISPTPILHAKTDVKYFNDVTVVNYSSWTLHLTAQFMDGSVATDYLQPYGTGNHYIDYIDLYNDPYVGIVISTLDGGTVFRGIVYKGQIINIHENSSKKATVSIK